MKSTPLHTMMIQDELKNVVSLRPGLRAVISGMTERGLVFQGITRAIVVDHGTEHVVVGTRLIPLMEILPQGFHCNIVRWPPGL